LLGEGGARKAAGWGFGARFLAGEKCCWRVEKFGLRSWGGSSRGAGSRAVEVFNVELNVEEDLFLVWPFGRVVFEGRVLLVDEFRTCRNCVTGGRERSCFTGSVVCEAGLPLRPLVEGRRCNSVVTGLLTPARVEGGLIEGLLGMLALELGGRVTVDVLRVGRLTVGRRLGDWLLRVVGAGLRIILLSLGSAVVDLPGLLPFSAGLRSERVREGNVDIAALLFIDSELARKLSLRSDQRT